MPSLTALAQLLQQLPGFTFEGLRDLVLLYNAATLGVKAFQGCRRRLRRWRKRRQARRRAECRRSQRRRSRR